MNNSYATLLVSSYVLTAVLRGNSLSLINNLYTDRAFLKWAISLGLINTIVGNISPKLATPFTVLVYTAMILQAANNGQINNAVINFKQFFGDTQNG